MQFVFSGLPSAVTEIVAAIKDRADDETDSFTDIGRYAVTDGAVTIPVAYHHLVRYFGLTHYSVWFKVLEMEGKDEPMESVPETKAETIDQARPQLLHPMSGAAIRIVKTSSESWPLCRISFMTHTLQC